MQLVQIQATNAGFFCDFSQEISLDALAISLLEEEMRRKAKESPCVRVFDMMRENAVSFFTHQGYDFLAARIESVSENIVSIFQVDTSCDYIEGGDYAYPDLSEDLQEVPCFRLTEVIAAINHVGVEEAVPVYRIKGVVFKTQRELRKGIKQRELALEFDHMRLGADLGLFFLKKDEKSVVWASKGVWLKERLLAFWHQHHAFDDYTIVQTPELCLEDSLVTWNGRENKWRKKILPSFEIQGESYVLRPTLEFGHADWVRRGVVLEDELPQRIAEMGRVFLSNSELDREGLYAQNAYTADEVHIICDRTQLAEEIIYSLHFFEKFIKIFDLKCQWYLRCVSKEGSERFGLEKVLADSLATCEISFVEKRAIHKHSTPGVEVCICDGYGLEWIGPTLEVQTIKFNKTATETKQEKQSVLPLFAIKRSLFTYVERFVALLVENYQGKFPLWLIPEQIRIIPVGAGNHKGAREAEAQIKAKGFRATVDESLQRLGAKIHIAELEKIPYIVIIGDIEEQKGVVSLRTPSSQKEKCEIKLELFLDELKKQIMTNSN